MCLGLLAGLHIKTGQKRNSVDRISLVVQRAGKGIWYGPQLYSLGDEAAQPALDASPNDGQQYAIRHNED